MDDRTWVRRGRKRARDRRQDRQAIVGGLLLDIAVLILFGLTLAVAWALGVATTWPVAGWVALGALALVLLSLQAFFLQEYLRWRRARAGQRRG